MIELDEIRDEDAAHGPLRIGDQCAADRRYLLALVDDLAATLDKAVADVEHEYGCERRDPDTGYAFLNEYWAVLAKVGK
jgi:hypothetical protein